MGKIKAKGQFHEIKIEDTGVSSTDSQDYTDHTVCMRAFNACAQVLTTFEIVILQI